MVSRQVKMQENRAKLIAAARRAFSKKGFANASMDELTAEAGLTRGALYHNFGDKLGLLAAVVEEIDSTMAAKAQAVGALENDPWKGLLAEGAAYIEMALDPEVQRIVLLDGPAFLGDPSQWPSQDSCLLATRQTVETLVADGVVKPLNVDAMSRLLNGAALNAALWVAASTSPARALPDAVAAFRELASGLLND